MTLVGVFRYRGEEIHLHTTLEPGEEIAEHKYIGLGEVDVTIRTPNGVRHTMFEIGNF